MQRRLIFESLNTPWWLALATLAVVVAGVLIVLLLRDERKLVPRRVGHTLLVLRLSILGLLLITFWQPVLGWTLSRSQSGRIVVAVDISESMATADSQADPAECLRWARALGMIGEGESADRIDAWIAAYAEGREPAWIDEREQLLDPAQRSELIQLRRESVERLIEEMKQISRKQLVLKLLQGSRMRLLERLEQIAPVEVVVFAAQARTADAQTLPELVREPPETVGPEVTDLSKALVPPPLGDEESTRVLGYVLFTDGQDTAQRDPVALAGREGPTSAPVAAVMLGSERRPKDLSIRRLDYPRSAFQDDRPLVQVRLGTSGYEGREIEVVLERPDQEPLTRKLKPESTITPVDFALEPASPGRHVYTLRVEPQPDETRTDNNTRRFAINVVDDTIRVWLIEGEPRWEFRFLDNALSRDERVEVHRVVFDQPYMGLLGRPYFPRRLDVPADVPDLAETPLAEADLVIVGDVSTADVTPQVWSLLERYVDEMAGTLVLVAGKRHMPRRHRSEVLDRLLPLERSTLRPINVTGPSGLGPPQLRGFRLLLTPDGRETPMLQFDADPIENARIWATLPGHLWGLVGEAKAAATVLASASAPGGDDPLAAERASAVIAYQPYGLGRVVWMGVDSTWRWRHRVGDRYHHRFWGQLGRWAAEHRMGAGNAFVRFSPDPADIEVGDEALFRARWTRRFVERFPGFQARVEVYRLSPEGTVSAEPFATIPLRARADRPLVHEGRAASLPEGEYQARLFVQGGDLGTRFIEAPLYVHPRRTPELSDLAANRTLLERLAAASGGRVFLPDELDALPELFQRPDDSRRLRAEIPLWDRWWWMCLFFALLTTEWVVRKWNGLP